MNDYSITYLKEEEKDIFTFNYGPRRNCQKPVDYFFKGVKLHEFDNIIIPQAMYLWGGIGALTTNLLLELPDLEKFDPMLIPQSETGVIDSAIAFTNSGDDHSWQHFMKDAAFLIPPHLDFLKSNKDIKLLFQNPADHIDFFIRDVCELENEMIYFSYNDTTSPHHSLKIKKLYVSLLYPEGMFWGQVPPTKCVASVGDLIKSKLKKIPQKNLTYLSRRNLSTRKVLNEDELVSFLEKYAQENNLNFVNFIHSDYSSLSERLNIFHNSKIVIAPHGGACMHVFACEKEAIMVEFIGSENPNCSHYAPSLVDFRVLFHNKGHGTRGYNINVEKVKKIVENDGVISYNYSEMTAATKFEDLSQELKDRFSMNGKISLVDKLFKRQGVNRSGADDKWASHYSKKFVNSMVARAAAKDAMHYGDTDARLYDALEKYPISGSNVLIIGSEEPCYEGMAIHYGAEKVTLVEYEKITTDHPKIDVLTVDEFSQSNEQYDVAISISSVEHSGLGRYGDPIDPDGDLKSMETLRNRLKQGGKCFLAVPYGSDAVEWNLHRIYGEIRFPLLISGFKVIEKFNGCHQPVYVLEKP